MSAARLPTPESLWEAPPDPAGVSKVQKVLMEGLWLAEREGASCALFLPPKYVNSPEDNTEGVFSRALHAQPLHHEGSKGQHSSLLGLP